MSDDAGAEEPAADEAPADGDAPLLPAFPKYEGLSFVSGAGALPAGVPDVPFPPPAAVGAAPAVGA